MPDGYESPLFGISQRLPPQNLQAEQALLGALMHNNKAIDRCGSLAPLHFADPVNGHVFGAIQRRIEAGRLADAVSLKGDFEHAGVLDAVGGTEYLVQLLTAMLGIINVTEYAITIQDCYRRRQVIDIGERVVNHAFGVDPSLAVGEIISAAAGQLDALMDGGSEGHSVSLDVAMDDAITALEEARHRQGSAGISTGFRRIDERIGGLESGTLTVVAGRPGMGKSAWGWQAAIAAARQGAGVLAVSLEMSSRELGRRALAAVSGVPIAAMKYGRVTSDQAGRIVLARREMAGLPVTIEDGAGLTASMIAARARSVKRKGLGLVLVDHLHIVRPDDADIRQGATWAIGRISGAMKRLAKDCGVPVLLLAQLNRGVEGRDDKRPGLADLRQAGDIEQDADAVGFVYREEYYLGHRPERHESESAAAYDSRCNGWQEKKDRAAGKAELIWAKVRDGESGADELRFDGPTTSFTEAE